MLKNEADAGSKVGDETKTKKNKWMRIKQICQIDEQQGTCFYIPPV